MSDRSLASFSAFLAVPSLECSAKGAGGFVQENIRRGQGHSASHIEVTNDVEPERLDGSFVVAEIRMIGEAANGRAPVSIELSSDEVAALKRVLGSFEDGQEKPEGVKEGDPRKLAAKIMFDTRKARGRLFPASMFSDPAWDMLIALYIAEKAPAAADLARSISASVTTAMRWIEILEAHKLIVREQSPTDRRAHTIRLSEQARANLDLLLSEAVRRWP
jgi:DNA-binding MarR family transcriptional regulator